MGRKNYAHELKQALAAGQARDYRKAVDILLGIISESDSEPKAYLYLGRSYHAEIRLGKLETYRFHPAISGKNSTAAPGLRPGSPPACHIGEAVRRHGQPPTAAGANQR